MKAHPVWRRLFLLRVKENWQSLHRKTLSCCPVWRIFNFNTFLLAMSCFAFWLGNCTLSNFWECFFVLQSENFQNLLMCVKCNLLHTDFQVMVKNLDVILTCNKSKSLGWLKVFGPTKSSSSMSSKVAYKKKDVEINAKNHHHHCISELHFRVLRRLNFFPPPRSADILFYKVKKFEVVPTNHETFLSSYWSRG